MTYLFHNVLTIDEDLTARKKYPLAAFEFYCCVKTCKKKHTYNKIVQEKNIEINQNSFCLFWVNPWSTVLFNLNFQPLEVVSRYRDTHDTQLQVTENLSDLQI